MMLMCAVYSQVLLATVQIAFADLENLRPSLSRSANVFSKDQLAAQLS